MKKRFLSTLLTVCLFAIVISNIPMTAFAETVANGTCGNNLTWTLDNDGTLTISGTGTMYNYNSGYSLKAPWYSLRSNIITVNIQNDVTSIGNYAFYNCINLTGVIIGNRDCDTIGLNQ